MPAPIYNQQIAQAGRQAQSYAASASIIITGLEKELNKKINNIKAQIVDPKNQLLALEDYIQRLSSTTTVEKIKKRKENQREGKNQDLFDKKKKGLRTKGRKLVSGSRPVELKAPSSRASSEVKAANPKLLREYVILQAKKQTGIPPEEQAEATRRLLEIEDIFKRDRLPPTLIKSYQTQIERIIKRELLSFIKGLLLKNLEDPSLVLEKILDNENANYLIQILSEGAEIDPYPVKELVETARKLGVNLDKWISYWNFEKIKINASGNITITPQAEEERTLLKDGLRALYFEFFLADPWLKKIRLYLQARQEIKILKREGIPEAEITETISQSRHLAWLKIITVLKDLHLKRVLSGSETKFIQFSQEIKRLTQKAKKLTQDVSEKGHSLIEAKLETLALRAAKYKLEFLSSMQDIDYQKSREKDILWIKHLISRLGLKEKQLKQT